MARSTSQRTSDSMPHVCQLPLGGVETGERSVLMTDDIAHERGEQANDFGAGVELYRSVRSVDRFVVATRGCEHERVT